MCGPQVRFCESRGRETSPGYSTRQDWQVHAKLEGRSGYASGTAIEYLDHFHWGIYANPR